MIARRIRIPVIALIAGASFTAHAQNADDWKLWPTGQQWVIGAGYFKPALETQIVVTDAEGNVGTKISFEDNLGLDDSQATALLSVDWRFLKRHRLSYQYFELKRNANAESSVTIRIGDDVLDIGLPIQSFFDITANEVTYSYSLLFDDKKDLSLGFGLSAQDLELGIRGTASSPNPGEIIDSQLASTAPLPTLKLGFNYAFNDQWLFISELGWLAVELELDDDADLEGHIIDSYVGVEWQAFRNVGFFVTYQVFDVDVEITNARRVFSINYNYRGPVLGMSANF